MRIADGSWSRWATRALARGRILVCLAVLAPMLVGFNAGAQPDGPTGPVEIVALSNRADLISGRDVLVEVVLPKGAEPSGVKVEVGGRDVSGAFGVRDDGRFYGRLEDLEVGVNRITATLPDGSGASLDVTNHPVGGPIFAGPQVRPWICTTEDNGLGRARDEQCNARTVYEYEYKSSVTGRVAAYDPDNAPLDVATTTTDAGLEVPYVVRTERGTLDRGLYEVKVLFDPGQPWEPWAPQQAWNRKLYWKFGGDCTPNHVQRRGSEGVAGPLQDLGLSVVDMALSRGFIVAAGGLNALGSNCNDVVSAEHVMMLKEHIVETYGEVRYTMSEGASGGSMQQHWIAANYPGLLDGIQPGASYPDIWETLQAAEDCHLMDRVFDQVSPTLWANPNDQAKAAGHLAVTTCRSFWDNPTGQGQFAKTWLDPDYGGGCLGGALGNPRSVLEGRHVEWVYDADKNPAGTRCTLPDYQVALFGRRPPEVWTPPEQAIGRGFANRPFDNTGVEYGLAALEAGDIRTEQFVDLNENIGGLDIDWNWQPERSVADSSALERAYLGGRITNGRELDRVPIMDIRGSSNLEIHTDVHSHVTRARLIAANGHAGNQVLWNSSCPLAPCREVLEESFLLLDRWLSAIETDDRDVSLAKKVVDNKPAEAVDACWIGDQRITDAEQCEALLPYFATPRMTAGAPRTDDVIKCQLKPQDRSDYTVEFTDGQWTRLQSAFPSGVCDYTKPGVAQQPPRGPWQTYGNGPDATPLGPAPQSTPFSP